MPPIVSGRIVALTPRISRYVGDVRPDDVAQRHVGLALEQRHDRRGQFGQRRAARHERDGDHRFADAQPAGRSPWRLSEEHVAAENQPGEASDDHRRPSASGPFRRFGAGIRRAPLRAVSWCGSCTTSARCRAASMTMPSMRPIRSAAPCTYQAVRSASASRISDATTAERNVAADVAPP